MGHRHEDHPTVTVLKDRDGVLTLRSRHLFRSARTKACQAFVTRTLLVKEITSIAIDPRRYSASISYTNHHGNRISVLRKISQALQNGHAKHDEPRQPQVDLAQLDGFPVTLSRYGAMVSTWQVAHEIPGRIRFKNPLLSRKKELCRQIERELMNTVGVERYATNPLTCSVLVIYHEAKIDRSQLVQVLDGALQAGLKRRKKDQPKLDFSLNNTSLVLAGVGQWAVPWLVPVNVGLILYNAVPSFKGALEVIRRRRVGVDILDSIIIVMCLLGGGIFPAALMNWCLSLGRSILSKTEDDSKKLLTEVFGKQPRFVWLYKEGQELEIPLAKLQAGDVVVVNTGETVPVDGEVVDGTAMIDQHVLTGESAPAEKSKGDQVFASTVLVAGKVFVRVAQTGEETASAKIRKILIKTAGYKIKAQSTGQKLADKAVLPTLGMSYLGYAVSGFDASLAIINCDYGTGIRVAAPLALLSTLARCASEGILVKEGKALEQLPQIDTFLFDKTGTLTQEAPEVADVLTADGFQQDEILRYAAAAEEKFTHPIARAILAKAQERGLSLPKRDEARYHVGFGITVGINGDVVKVGSARFMRMEGIRIPHHIEAQMEMVQQEGGSLVMVASNDSLRGALCLKAAQRPEATQIIQELRAHRVKEIVLISGDHEGPTKRLAESLGMDRYFAEVLPQDKGHYVRLLQREGKKVAFVGDGINDSIALKRADVSISLRGASSIATDTAQIVFMEENLAKLPRLLEISDELKKNVTQSWMMLVVPNTLCILGALFGVFGLTHSLILNNGTIFLATLNGTRPLYKIYDKELERTEATQTLTDDGHHTRKSLKPKSQARTG